MYLHSLFLVSNQIGNYRNNHFLYFRLNSDWLWDNFPNERRFASMIFVAKDVLTPKVVQTIYNIRLELFLRRSITFKYKVLKFIIFSCFDDFRRQRRFDAESHSDDLQNQVQIWRQKFPRSSKKNSGTRLL